MNRKLVDTYNFKNYSFFKNYTFSSFCICMMYINEMEKLKLDENNKLDLQYLNRLTKKYFYKKRETEEEKLF